MLSTPEERLFWTHIALVQPFITHSPGSNKQTSRVCLCSQSCTSLVPSLTGSKVDSWELKARWLQDGTQAIPGCHCQLPFFPCQRQQSLFRQLQWNWFYSKKWPLLAEHFIHYFLTFDSIHHALHYVTVQQREWVLASCLLTVKVVTFSTDF